jgi:hypothetical protein
VSIFIQRLTDLKILTRHRFVGCCATFGQDVCALNCAQGNLYSASFTASLHGTFPDASCEAGSNFYTCNGTNPAFLGCCKTNPCASGCPKNNLTPAFLGTDAKKIAYGALSSSSSSVPSSTIGISTTSTTAASRTGTAGAGTATKDAAATAMPNKNGPNVGAIAGGVVGGAFVLAVIIGLLVYFFCYAKRSRKGHEETLERRQSDLPAMTAAHEKPKGVYSPDGKSLYTLERLCSLLTERTAPPGYVSPNPNDYYGAHAGQHQYQHQYVPEPQELPVEASSTGFVPQNAALHQRNVSELSGDTIMRSELETPLATPVGSPQRQTQATWQSASSPRSGSNWVAHQSWQSQGGPDHAPGPAQGLGLYGVNENETTASGQR